jgi:membrane-associated protease RseP (regulator of RpoE activity)
LYPTLEAHRKFQDRTWLHWLLLAATFATTTLAGVFKYLSYLSDYTPSAVPVLPPWPVLLLGSLWYSGTILLILGAHEMGHYLACRYYQVDATRPFFIPMPLFLEVGTGTLGAFIRIREMIPTKRALFDIGVAGPVAGFVFLVPALFIGVAMSHVAKVPPNFVGVNLGEPLLFKIASKLIWGTIPDGYSINLHPMAFAAWFGMLATALNLFPIGQLDGGHLTYAVFGRRSSTITIGAIVLVVALNFFSHGWLLWTVILVTMTLSMGPHHPRAIDEEVPLDRARLWLAVAAAVIFVLCFTYAPIEPTELLK